MSGVDPIELRKLAEEWRSWATKIELKHNAERPAIVQNLVYVLEHCAQSAESLARRSEQ